MCCRVSKWIWWSWRKWWSRRIREWWRWWRKREAVECKGRHWRWHTWWKKEDRQWRWKHTKKEEKESTDCWKWWRQWLVVKNEYKKSRCAFHVEWIVGEKRRKDQPCLWLHWNLKLRQHEVHSKTFRHWETICKKRWKRAWLAVTVLLKHEKLLTSLLLYSTWKWIYLKKPLYFEMLILFKLLSIWRIFSHLLKIVTLLSKWLPFLYTDCQPLERLSLTLRGLTSNGKRQKWNFCHLSLALWTVEWKYLYLWRIVGDIFLFLRDLMKD